MEILNHYLDQAKNHAAHLSSNLPLEKIILQAQNKWSNSVLPHRRIEDWKYTNLNTILSNNYSFKPKEKEIFNFKDHNEFMVVNILNGQVCSVLPEGITLTPIKDIKSFTPYAFIFEDTYFSEDFINLMGQAFLQDGYLIEISQNTKIEKPLFLQYQFTGDKEIYNMMNIFHIHKNAKLDVLESFQSSDNSLINYTSHINLNQNASMGHSLLQDHHHEALSFIQINSHCDRDSNYNHCIINTGAKISRSNIYLNLHGENASAQAHGLYALKNDQHHDTMSFIKHKSPHTYSHQLYKGILADSARGIFTGKVRVEKDAQLINAEQLNKNLLLSKKAQANSRPQMEIYADDVKCAHGSTTGQMSEDELFYFESRGIKPEKARAMLANGFSLDVILKINNKVIRNLLTNHLNNLKLMEQA